MITMRVDTGHSGNAAGRAPGALKEGAAGGGGAEAEAC
jgi:hypothetical protein